MYVTKPVILARNARLNVLNATLLLTFAKYVNLYLHFVNFILHIRNNLVNCDLKFHQYSFGGYRPEPFYQNFVNFRIL